MWTELLILLIGLYLGPFVLLWIEFLMRPSGQPPHARKRAQQQPTSSQPYAVIIGAGPAGIAAAGALNALGVTNVVIERTSSIASSWRGHYKRLHLHTAHPFSGLPHVPLPKHYPRYISRQQVVDYVTGYATIMQIQVNFQESVLSVSRNSSNDWEVITEQLNGSGQRNTYKPQVVIVATGECTDPIIPSFPFQDQYKGTVVHSSKYHTAEDYRGKKVLVVGFGNTGGELSIDLWEHGCDVTVIARSPFNVVARDSIVLGAAIARYLPIRLQVAAERFLSKQQFGDLPKYGVTCPIPGIENAVHYRLINHHEAPVVDIGQIDLIRKSEIKIVSSEIEKFTPTGVVFKDGKEETFDAVVLATGFKHNLPQFIDKSITAVVINDIGFPKKTAAEIEGVRGLYFVGFADTNGRILRIREDAEKLAKQVSRQFLNK